MNLLNSFSFELPTKIEYGVGAARGLVDAVKKLNAGKLLDPLFFAGHLNFPHYCHISHFSL